MIETFKNWVLTALLGSLLVLATQVNSFAAMATAANQGVTAFVANGALSPAHRWQQKQEQVVSALGQLISENYPDKTGAHNMSLALKGMTWQPSYRAPQNLDELVQQLNDTLASAQQDSYLEVFQPAPIALSNVLLKAPLTAPLKAPLKVTVANVDESFLNGSVNYSARNKGIEQVAMTPDGIGYLKLSKFARANEGQAISSKEFSEEPNNKSIETPNNVLSEIAGAMANLQGSCALILDFRSLDGGDIETAQYLLSYFFPEGYAFGRLVNENQRETYQLSSVNLHKGSRINQQTPVVLLTSPFMQASGEFFAYQLKQRPQTALIGCTTMGVATWLKQFSLPLGLKIEMPVAHYQDSNGESWQQIGISPDIELATEKSLAKAKQLTVNWCSP